MSQAMNNIRLQDCMIEHWFIYEFILSMCTTYSHFFSYFHASMHSLTVVVMPCSPLIIVSEILTMVDSVNKLKSWLGFFEILWWYNDPRPSPDELAKWQHFTGEFTIGWQPIWDLAASDFSFVLNWSLMGLLIMPPLWKYTVYSR